MNEKSVKCLSCDAISLWAKLQSMDTDNGNISDNLSVIKKALIWILENTDYPAGKDE